MYQWCEGFSIESTLHTTGLNYNILHYTVYKYIHYTTQNYTTQLNITLHTSHYDKQ